MSLYTRWLRFQNSPEKGGGRSDFSHKNGGVGKIGGVVVSLIFIIANPFQCYLSLSVWCVCVLFTYTISVSIICVSQKEPRLIASNQEIY